MEYKIYCNNCTASYIGQTKRKLGTRIKEHKEISINNKDKPTVINEHISMFGHEFDWENTIINL